MSSNEHKRVLVAPLDWGLGHTTRCIPLIAHLQQLGHSILFAGNGWQRQYINKALPGIETIDVPGYEVRYTASASGFKWYLLAQVPRLLTCIRREHEWLLRVVRRHNVHGVISDNRYGLYHPDVPSVFITHQLQVQTGMGNMADALLRKLHYRYINRFNECWVPDVPGASNLSGVLAHPSVLPRNTQYLGLLSQLEINSDDDTMHDHLLILLSGPEPQRTILSDLLWSQVSAYSGKVVFVEGSLSATKRHRVPANVSYHLQLTKDELQPLMQQASIVICRSGYSTLMDLAALDKKAIVIPTPGQTEQEYLGTHLHRQGIFYCAAQKSFDLKQALKGADSFPFHKLQLMGAHSSYKQVLAGWVAGL